jgi:hypothetical protein
MARGVQDRGGGIEDGKDQSTLLMPWPCHAMLYLRVSSQSVMYRSYLMYARPSARQPILAAAGGNSYLTPRQKCDRFPVVVVVVNLSVQRLLHSTT